MKCPHRASLHEPSAGCRDFRGWADGLTIISAACQRFSSGGTCRTAGRHGPACYAHGCRRCIATPAGRLLRESCQRPKPRPGEGRRLGWRSWGGRSWPAADCTQRHFCKLVVNVCGNAGSVVGELAGVLLQSEYVAAAAWPSINVRRPSFVGHSGAALARVIAGKIGQRRASVVLAQRLSGKLSEWFHFQKQSQQFGRLISTPV